MRAQDAKLVPLDQRPTGSGSQIPSEDGLPAAQPITTILSTPTTVPHHVARRQTD